MVQLLTDLLQRIFLIVIIDNLLPSFVADLADWFGLWLPVLHFRSCSSFRVKTLEKLFAEVDVMLEPEIDEF